MKILFWITIGIATFSACKSVPQKIEINKSTQHKVLSLTSPQLTTTFFEEQGRVEICLEEIHLLPEATHFLTLPEGVFSSLELTDMDLAMKCIYFDLGRVIDLVTISDNNWISVAIQVDMNKK